LFFLRFNALSSTLTSSYQLLYDSSVYGADGKRKNTRAVRWRERYSAERHDILEELMNMNPATRKSGLFKRKRSKKVRIPIEQHPTYNFIGLIIGPRGKTQKDLESKTGCKIAIRGRGRYVISIMLRILNPWNIFLISLPFLAGPYTV
jgi:hypothetical protein